MERFRKFSSETQKYVRQLSNHTHKDMNRRKALGVGGLSLLGLDHLAAVDGGEESKPDQKFYHLHYFRFKEEVTEEEITQLMKELAGLKDQIHVLNDFWVCKNVSPHGAGFQWGEVALFEKPEDLEVYDKHPEHRKLVRKIGPKLAGGASMDFIPVEPI